MHPDPFKRGPLIKAFDHEWLQGTVKGPLFMTDREWQDNLWNRNLVEEVEVKKPKRPVYSDQEDADNEDLNDNEEEYQWSSQDGTFDEEGNVFECDRSFITNALTPGQPKNRLVDLNLLDKSDDYIKVPKITTESK